MALKAYGPYKDATPTLGNLVLAAPSGGGVSMQRLATSGNRATSNVRECWGFDSLYNSGDVDPWRRWAKSDPQKRRLYHYYRGNSQRKLPESQRDSSSGRIDKLPNIFAIPSQESDHYKLVPLLPARAAEGHAVSGQQIGEAAANRRGVDEASEDRPCALCAGARTRPQSLSIVRCETSRATNAETPPRASSTRYSGRSRCASAATLTSFSPTSSAVR